MPGKPQRLPTAHTQIVRKDAKNRPGQVYARFRWTENGKTEHSTAAWFSVREVEIERAKWEARLRLGLPQNESPAKSANGMTVGEAVSKYADDLERRGVGGAGYRTNIVNRAVPIVQHLGTLMIAKIDMGDLDSYVSQRRGEQGGRRGNRPLRKATVKDEVRLIRCAWTWARKRGMHDREWPGTPSLKGWPDDARPPRKLSDSEVDRLAATAAIDRPELARLLQFMAACPRRPVAIFALRRKDVQRALDSTYAGNDLAYFETDKGGVGRGWGPLLLEAREVLLAHLRDTIGPPDEPVWRTATGMPYTATRIGGALRYLCTKAGITGVVPYDFRKHAAVRAYEWVGRSLKATARFTGHRDVTVLVKNYLFAEEDLITAAVRGERASGAS